MDCSKNAKKLCGECDTCLGRCVKTHPKGSQFWSENVDANSVPISSLYVMRGSKIWYTWICLICDHLFPSQPFNFLRLSIGCPFCASKILCENNGDGHCVTCWNKSFASSPRAGNVIGKTLDELSQIFLNCNDYGDFWCDCGHPFPAKYLHVTSGSWCPYCSNPPSKLCKNNSDQHCMTCYNKSFASSEKAKNVVDKSIDLTQIFLHCDKITEFMCDNNHSPFRAGYGDVHKNNHWCSHCHHHTQSRIFEFAQEHYENVITPGKFDWCRSETTGRFLPFDMTVNDIAIIEPDGNHHFFQVSNWASPEKNRATDVYKMKLALKNGYWIIRMVEEDARKNFLDWKKELLQAIKRCKGPPQVIYIAWDPMMYSEHQRLLAEAIESD